MLINCLVRRVIKPVVFVFYFEFFFKLEILVQINRRVIETFVPSQLCGRLK